MAARKRKKGAKRIGKSRQKGKSRLAKYSANATKAGDYVNRGRDAEMRGEFATAAGWYKKAGALLTKAGKRSKARARLWKARGKDVNGGQGMGTIYRG